MEHKRLDGWKVIADFLGRDARTVQRWERVRDLPVRRLPGGEGSSVFAFTDELTAWRSGGSSSPVDASALAPGLLVLPLDYHAPDASLAFVADGLAQELIGRLATTPLASLRVLSWTTSKAYRAKAQDARRLARELSIGYLLEGSVVAALDRWVIDIRVVDAARDQVVLAERFGCAGGEILLLQSAIAQSVAHHLSLHLAGEMIAPVWSREVDPRSFLAFVDGVRHYARGDQASNATALARFDEALRIDPHFVPARVHKGLTLMYSDRSNGWLRDDVQREVRNIAAECADEGDHLVSYAMLVNVLGRADGDWDRIDHRMRSTVAANPSAVAPRHQLAGNLTLRRRFGEANAILLPVAQLDQSLDADRHRAIVRLWSRDFDGAIALFDSMLEREPAHTYAGLMRFMTAIYKRDSSAAHRYSQGMAPMLNRAYQPFIDGCLAAVEGERAVARVHRDGVRERAEASQLSYYLVGMLDGLTGDAGGAAENLERSHARAEMSATLAAVDPSYDAVRGDPQFRRVVRSMGLPV